MSARIWPGLTVAALLGIALAAGRAQEADEPNLSPATPDTATTATPAPAPQPAAAPQPVNEIQIPRPSLPPLLDQVVRLSKSGADENVIRAYIEKAAPAYRITGNDIIDLQDRGLSTDMILALIEHSRSVAPSEDQSAEMAVSSSAPSATDPAATTPVQNEAVGDYHNALSPYGTWVDVPEYGLCWQPTVVVLNPDWRPYSDHGDWIWSDHGWYWNSYYSWGWAPFHYGRWFSHPHRGWLWYPDRVWGPSWVSWRFSSSFCGWAPLPPGACFTAGFGWTFHGARVRADCGFGLRSSHFTFVKHERFFDRHVGRNALARHEASGVFHRTAVNNHYTTGPRNRIINHGVGRDTIAAATGRSIGEVPVRNLARSGARVAVPADRLAVAAHRGSQSFVPQSAVSRSITPAAAGARVATMVSRPSAVPAVQRGASRAAVAATAPVARALPNYSRAVPAAPVTRTLPNNSRALSLRIQPARPVRGFSSVAAAPVSRAPQQLLRSSRPAMSGISVPRSVVAPRTFSQPRIASPSLGARPVMRGGGVPSRGAVSRGAVSRGASPVARGFSGRR